MIAGLVRRVAPQLLEPFGIGVDTAAEILVVTGDNPQARRVPLDRVLQPPPTPQHPRLPQPGRVRGTRNRGRYTFTGRMKPRVHSQYLWIPPESR